MQVTTHSGTNFGRKMSLMLRTFSLWFHRQRSELCGKKLHPIWPHFVTKLSRSWSMLLIVVAEWHMSNRQVSSPYKPQSHKDLTQEGTVQMTRKHLKIKKKKSAVENKNNFHFVSSPLFFLFLNFQCSTVPAFWHVSFRTYLKTWTGEDSSGRVYPASPHPMRTKGKVGN